VSCPRQDFHQPLSCPAAPSCVETGCRPAENLQVAVDKLFVEELMKTRDTARKERDEVRIELEHQENRASFWKAEVERAHGVLKAAGIDTGLAERGIEELVRDRDHFKLQRDSLAEKAVRADDLARQVDQLTRERADFKMKWDNTVEELAKAYKDLEALRKIKAYPIDKLTDEALRALRPETPALAANRDKLLERLEMLASHSPLDPTEDRLAEVITVLWTVLKEKHL
jgi:chromosome segregation ATPase